MLLLPPPLIWPQGGPVMEQMAPKMDAAVAKFEAAGISIPAAKVRAPAEIFCLLSPWTLPLPAIVSVMLRAPFSLP